MRLSDLFQPEDLLVGFRPLDKWEAIRRLVEHLVERGRLKPASGPAIVDAVVAREKSMSTGMEHGIAIPHAAVDAVDQVVASMGIVGAQDGLPFENIDGSPTRIVVLLVIPRAQKLLHIRTLADIARVLNRDAVREQLIASPTSAAAWAALSVADGPKRA
jgi:mannitol/fructose-specific phosphotransferase system IIA component (Ntr-type)